MSFITAQRLFPANGEHGPCMQGAGSSVLPCQKLFQPPALRVLLSILRPAAAEKRGRAGRGQVIAGAESRTAACAIDLARMAMTASPGRDEFAADC